MDDFARRRARVGQGAEPERHVDASVTRSWWRSFATSSILGAGCCFINAGSRGMISLTTNLGDVPTRSERRNSILSNRVRKIVSLHVTSPARWGYGELVMPSIRPERHFVGG